MRVARLIFLKGLAAGALAVALFAGCKTGQKPKATASKPTLPWRESFDIATEAYIFGYPLVTMDMTRRVMTNVRYPDGMHAPMGQFALNRTYPLASNHDVAVPNADTLHTIIWLDVSREPWVISLPDTKGRYCLFPPCWTVGPPCLEPSERAPPAPAPRKWPSPAPVGKATCLAA